MSFPSFSLQTQIRADMAAEVAVEIDLLKLSAKRILLVSDPGVMASGLVDPIKAVISDKAEFMLVFTEVMQDPTLDLMDQLGTLCRENRIDAIVAVGGGACMDAAKGAAIVACSGLSIRDAIGEDRVTVTPLPVLAVPTTAGTGSEVSWHISVNDVANELKVTVRSPKAVCHTAILDPRMISTVPPMVAAAAGMDALTHNLEAYVGNVGRWELTDALTLHACRMIGDSMLAYWTKPTDPELARQMLIASSLGGIALSHSRTGIVHQMARPLGAIFHVPHGLANAVLLPWCLEFTWRHDITRYAAIARAIGADVDGMSKEAAAYACVSKVHQMNRAMGIPESLAHFGVTDSEVARMASNALQGKDTISNPCKASLEDVMGIYFKAIRGSND